MTGLSFGGAFSLPVQCVHSVISSVPVYLDQQGIWPTIQHLCNALERRFHPLNQIQPTSMVVCCRAFPPAILKQERGATVALSLSGASRSSISPPHRINDDRAERIYHLLMHPDFLQ